MLSRLTGQLLICGLRAYQIVLAPHLGPCCRFTPSCSAYAIEAIGRHGPLRGTWLACRRLWRCRPFGPCGDDPVPPPRARNPQPELSCTGNT